MAPALNMLIILSSLQNICCSLNHFFRHTYMNKVISVKKLKDSLVLSKKHVSKHHNFPNRKGLRSLKQRSNCVSGPLLTIGAAN